MSEALLPVGAPAPAFDATTSGGGRASLAELLREGAVLLMFYPQDDTPGCTRQMCTARDEGPRYAARGVRRFGVNPGSGESHDAFVEKYGLDFPLIVDDGGRIAQAYGVLREDGDVTRATFLIAPNGRLAFAATGAHDADAVLEALGG